MFCMLQKSVIASETKQSQVEEFFGDETKQSQAKSHLNGQRTAREPISVTSIHRRSNCGIHFDKRSCLRYNLLVVTRDHSLPGSFAEKMALKLPIANALSSLREKADLDLLVYTLPMYEKFKEMDSLLKKEIEKEGTLVYEESI